MLYDAQGNPIRRTPRIEESDTNAIATPEGEYRNPIAHGFTIAFWTGAVWLLFLASRDWHVVPSLVILVLWAAFGWGLFGRFFGQLRRRQWGRLIAESIGASLGGGAAYMFASAVGWFR